MSRGLFKKGILEKFIGKKRLPSIEGSQTVDKVAEENGFFLRLFLFK